MATTFLHGLGKNSVSLWSYAQALMLLPKGCKQEVLQLLCESESGYLLRELYTLYLQILFKRLNPKYISDFSRILVELNGLCTSFQNYWRTHEVRKTNYRQSFVPSNFSPLKIIAVLMSNSHGQITGVKNLIKFSRWH